jgi:hypothetical protein
LSNLSLEDLAFCAIPAVSNTWLAPSLAPQINLFAGQLYLRDAWEYFALCRFLGLSYKPPPEGVTVGVDGYVKTFILLFYGHLEIFSENVPFCSMPSDPLFLNKFFLLYLDIQERSRIMIRHVLGHLDMLPNNLPIISEQSS